MKILAISGSLRGDSLNSRVLRGAAEMLPAGVELELWGGLKEVPPYDEDDDVTPAPAPVARLRAAIAGADALLIATPEYNSSIPGQLKNALDWASRPYATSVLRNKPVAVIGASTGMFGAVWAQAELRKVLGAIGARVVGAELPVGKAHERCDRIEQPQQAGNPQDADLPAEDEAVRAEDEAVRAEDEELRTKFAELLDALVAEADPRLAAAA